MKIVLVLHLKTNLILILPKLIQIIQTHLNMIWRLQQKHVRIIKKQTNKQTLIYFANPYFITEQKKKNLPT